MAYTTITDPSAYFQTALYTGNGTVIGSGGNVITNNANSGNFKPDWTWHKVRSTANDHQIYDSSRGVKIRLNTNATNSDFTLNEGLQSFDTNGFTVGSDNGVNQSSQTFVAWQWKANGGTTSSNTDGTITSTVQANTTAGFNIVTFTSNGSNGQTVGHGLGVAPKMIITKNRSATGSWYTYNYDIGANHWIRLNGTDAKTLNTNVWGNTHPTSSVFTIGLTDLGYSNTNNVIAYCFAEKQGYSKFGSYTGNGNADGPFIYTGFKPAWVMIKLTSSTENWIMMDNKRDTFNNAYRTLLANATSAEDTSNDARYSLDFVSNGFKVRSNAHATSNGNGSTYIYMAFAEHPFVSSEGVPTTAR